jgi:hypothetical protein
MAEFTTALINWQNTACKSVLIDLAEAERRGQKKTMKTKKQNQTTTKQKQKQATQKQSQQSQHQWVDR